MFYSLHHVLPEKINGIGSSISRVHVRKLVKLVVVRTEVSIKPKGAERLIDEAVRLPLPAINLHVSPSLALLSALSTSLGEYLNDHLTETESIKTFFDCLCSSFHPEIHSPHPDRLPLSHIELWSFISNFALPTRNTLGPEDRVVGSSVE